jgi:hypothetical protein
MPLARIPSEVSHLMLRLLRSIRHSLLLRLKISATIHVSNHSHHQRLDVNKGQFFSNGMEDPSELQENAISQEL